MGDLGPVTFSTVGRRQSQTTSEILPGILQGVFRQLPGVKTALKAVLSHASMKSPGWSSVFLPDCKVVEITWEEESKEANWHFANHTSFPEILNSDKHGCKIVFKKVYLYACMYVIHH